MSAQASSDAGGDDKKLNKASKCEKCGNRHEGACWPKCGTCGKAHKGPCRYAQPIPTTGTGNAGQVPSQAGSTMGFNAQQFGYPQVYGEIPSPIMGPGMASGMGGQVFGPFGNFGSPYPAQYGAFGAVGNPGWCSQDSAYQGWGNPSWGVQIPAGLSQGFGSFPTPPMGQGSVGSLGSIGGPTRAYGGNKQGVAEWHEIQKWIGRPRDNRKPESKEEPNGKKEEKDPLATKPAGIEKPISKSAKQRAKKRANQKKKDEEEKKDEEMKDERKKRKAEEKEEEEKRSRDPMAGPVDFELVRLLHESGVENVGNAEAAPVDIAAVHDEEMEDTAPPPEDAIDDLSRIDAQSLIQEAVERPSGFQFPQDLVRVERMARLLEEFGQERILSLSESAAANCTTILWEAFQIDLLNEQNSELAASARD